MSKSFEYDCLQKEIYKLKGIMYEYHKELVEQGVLIEQILKNQQEKIFEAHDMVVIYDGVNNIKVYEKGKDITKGMTDVHIYSGRCPEISYDKKLTDDL